MSSIAKKNVNPSKKRIKWIILLLIGFMIWAGMTLYKQSLDIKKLQAEISELEGEEQQALTSKEELEKKVHLLQNDEYIAEIARKYYFLSKPGEIIFISPED